MARISPFLQMLLGGLGGKLRPTEKQTPPGRTPPFVGEPIDSPTVPISARPSLNPPSVTPSTVPTSPVSAGLPAPAAPTLPIRPRPVDEAADVVRKYDQGLHPDPKTGEWVPHKRNKFLQTLEGIGNVAASGVGVNLQSILHPRGTHEQQARRRLSDEVNIEGLELKRRGAEAEIAKDESYGEHLKKLEELSAAHAQQQADIQQALEEGRLTRADAVQKMRELELAERERHNMETERLRGQGSPYTLNRNQVRYGPDGQVIAGGAQAPAPVRRGGGRRAKGARAKGLHPDVEAQIRSAAKARGLDPDTAVQRARSRH